MNHVIDKENVYNLTVQIEGVVAHKGTLYVAIYAKEEDFLKKPFIKSSYKTVKIPKKIIYKDLPRGEYAITLFQDLNGNEKLDKLFSIPTEPYGISNNPSAFPKFNNSKFNLTKNETIKIKIQN
jgi:uncharacterized protein (DUF2141 family)